jgi:hypothetical protein
MEDKGFGEHLEIRKKDYDKIEKNAPSVLKRTGNAKESGWVKVSAFVNYNQVKSKGYCLRSQIKGIVGQGRGTTMQRTNAARLPSASRSSTAISEKKE